jgi:long-chain fatty acid transport protein
MNFRTFAGATALAAVTLATLPALATEGYFSNGYGVVNKSMAGAGVALGFDGMSQVTNPASLAVVQTQFTADLSVFSPRSSYTVTGAPSGGVFSLQEGSFDSDRQYFYVPSFSNVWEIDDSSSWGWALYSNGGMDTTWNEPASGVFGGGKAGLDLGQAFLQFTYAQEISPEVYLGVSPIIAVQRFRAFGLSQFDNATYSSSPGDVTNNGYDWSYGYGGKIGIQAGIGGGFTFGAAYQSQMFMTDFNKYSGLLANGGEFDIPATLQAGFAWEADSGFLVALDYKRIFYGDIDAVANSFSRLDTGTGVLLGSNAGPGFGWRNLDIFKLGVQVPVGSSVTLRAGASINNDPVARKEVLFNILAPEIQQQHYTAGLTWQVGDNNAISLAGMYSPSASVLGPNAQDPNQTIELEASQWEATVGWSWTF